MGSGVNNFKVHSPGVGARGVWVVVVVAVVALVFMCREKGLSFKCRQTPEGRLNRNGINEPVSVCSSVGGLATGPNWLTTTTATNVLQFLVAIHSWRQSMFGVVTSLRILARRPVHSLYATANGSEHVYIYIYYIYIYIYTHSAKIKKRYRLCVRCDNQ